LAFWLFFVIYLSIMHKQRGFTGLGLILLIVIVAGVAGYFVFVQKFDTQITTSPIPSNGIFCTQDAKQCPDGSYVGRTGPKCEFALCPTPKNETSSWKTYANKTFGHEFKYPASFVNPNTSLGELSENAWVAEDKNIKCYLGLERLDFSPGWKTQKSEDVIIATYKFQKNSYTYNGNLVAVVYSSYAPKTAGLSVSSTEKNGTIGIQCLAVVDQILSTFKFTK